MVSSRQATSSHLWSRGQAFSSLCGPADENHPFGHGKIESLAGVFSGVALLLAAAAIAWNSILEIRTLHHTPEWFTLPVLVAVVATEIFLSKRFSLSESLSIAGR
jgi:divalent metal cation (Fe/Co/Zn/Cd) transporter